MTAASPGPRGLYCPDCRGVRLTVTSSSRPCAGVKIRYRKCSACGLRLKTREIVVRLGDDPGGEKKSRGEPGTA